MEDVIKAFENPGISPSYHMKVKGRLKKEWPALYLAIEKMTLLAVNDVCDHKWMVSYWTQKDGEVHPNTSTNRAVFVPNAGYKATQALCTKCLTTKAL